MFILTYGERGWWSVSGQMRAVINNRFLHLRNQFWKSLEEGAGKRCLESLAVTSPVFTLVTTFSTAASQSVPRDASQTGVLQNDKKERRRKKRKKNEKNGEKHTTRTKQNNKNEKNRRKKRKKKRNAIRTFALKNARPLRLKASLILPRI